MTLSSNILKLYKIYYTSTKSPKFQYPIFLHQPILLIIFLIKGLLYFSVNNSLYLQTLPANTDSATIVDTQLPTPIRALCLRVHPLEWSSIPEVKIEVFGCPSI